MFSVFRRCRENSGVSRQQRSVSHHLICKAIGLIPLTQKWIRTPLTFESAPQQKMSTVQIRLDEIQLYWRWMGTECKVNYDTWSMQQNAVFIK